MSTTLFAPVEAPVHDWLQAAAIVGVGTDAYIGLPSTASFPAIEITLIDSGVQPGDSPVLSAMFSFSVWGGNTSASQRLAAAEAAYALASLLQSTNHAALDDDLVLMGSQLVLGPTPRYDPDGTPRYVIEAALTLVKVA